MKKSTSVPATYIIGLAAGVTGLSGCGSSYTSQCQDAYGRALPDYACGGSRYYPGARWVRIRSGGFGYSGSGYSGGS